MADQVEPTGAAPWQAIEEGMGFKRLTPENWLEPDSIMRAFVHGAMSGQAYVPTGEQRVREIMGIELSPAVPLEVRKLFAVTRGALCYGYFFYPLYALASEQLSRVAETAVARKYEHLGGPKPNKVSFKGKLDYLEKEGLITERDAVWWARYATQGTPPLTPKTTIPNTRARLGAGRRRSQRRSTACSGRDWLLSCRKTRTAPGQLLRRGDGGLVVAAHQTPTSLTFRRRG